MADRYMDADLDVPGTTRILDERGEAFGSNNFTLVPSPSADPNDPLNWSQSRKRLHLACIILYTMGICFCAGSLAAIYVPVSEATGLTLDDINSGVGYLYLCIGVFQIVTQSIALAIGKRPIYCMSILCAGAYPFWVTRVKSTGEWYGMNVFQGFVASALFTLPELSISDVFFYHERAAPMGMYVATTYGAALFAPIASGYIYTSMGWKAPPYFAGGFCFLTAIILFIFLEESTFRRQDAAVVVSTSQIQTEIEESKDKDLATANVVGVEGHLSTPLDAEVVHVHASDRLVSPWPGPKPWKFFTISPNAKSLVIRGCLYPVMMLRLPAILWCGLVFGLYQIFYNCMIALTSGVLSSPPYEFQPNSVGLTFLSPMAAIIPGAILGGMITDWYTIRQAKKNHGISEAETKLRLMIIPTILTPFGLLMMGLGPYYGAHWMVYVAGEFVLTVAGPLATLLSMVYAFDSFHEIHPNNPHGVQAEIQSCAPYVQSLIAFAMVITFAFNYAITPWAFEWGFRNWCITAVAFSLVVNLSHFLLLKYGKRMRIHYAPVYRKIINW